MTRGFEHVFKKEKLVWICRHWKIVLHLLLGTHRFGVNNKWRERFSVWYGLHPLKIFWNVLRVYPIIRMYHFVKWRTIGCNTLDTETCELLFPKEMGGR